MQSDSETPEFLSPSDLAYRAFFVQLVQRFYDEYLGVHHCGAQIRKPRFRQDGDWEYTQSIREWLAIGNLTRLE